jgi:hypothetical protein
LHWQRDLFATYRCMPDPTSCKWQSIRFLGHFNASRLDAIQSAPCSAICGRGRGNGIECRGRGFGRGANAGTPESMSDARTRSFPAGAANGAVAVALDGSGTFMVVVIAGISSAGVATSATALPPDKTVRTNQPAMKAAKATATPNPMIKVAKSPRTAHVRHCFLSYRGP